MIGVARPGRANGGRAARRTAPQPVKQTDLKQQNNYTSVSSTVVGQQRCDVAGALLLPAPPHHRSEINPG